MELLVLVAIVIIIILINKNNSLKDELDHRGNFCPKCGFDLRTKPNHDTSHNTSDVLEKKEEVPAPQNVEARVNTPTAVSVEKKKIDDKEIKNSLILITGAVLIIIAAIVFLTSTWEFTLDIVKTMVIFLMFGVFLAGSHIAKKYLGLEKISKAFIYIAFSYLPLALFSICLFGLLGHYLSYQGAGKYVYLAISSIILSIVYYLYMKKNNDVLIAIYSLVFQLLSCTFIGLFIKEDVHLVLLVLSLFVLLINSLHFDYRFKSKEFDLRSIVVLTILLLVGLVVYAYDFSFFYLLALIVNIFNLYYLLVDELKEEKYQKMFDYSSIGMIIYGCLLIPTIFNLGTNVYMYEASLLVGALLTFGINYFRNRFNIVNYLTFSVPALFIYLAAVTDSFKYTYLFIIILFFISIIYYLFKKNGALSVIIPILGLIAIFDVFVQIDINSIYFIPFLLIYIAINLVNLKDKKLEITINITSIIGLVISYLIVLVDFNNPTFLIITTIILFTFYFIYMCKNKTIGKVFAYILVNLFIVGLFDIFNLFDYSQYILPISLLILFGLEYIDKKNPKAGNVLIIIESFVTFIVLMGVDNMIIPYIISLLVFILFLYKNKLNYTWLYLPVVTVDFNFIANFDKENIVYIVMPIIMFGILTYFTYYSKKLNIGILTLVHLGLLACIGLDKHIPAIMFILISGLLFYLFKKDKFKFLLYLSIFILYGIFIVDLGLDNLTLFDLGSFVVFYVICSRDIFIKHTNSYKAFEYIVLIILNLIAIGSFVDEADGMLFVGLLLILSILGYVKKWGPIFITSLVFILINMVILTRMFWLSIPWWVYLLLVGSILIGFAIRNEMVEKKDSNKIKEFMKKLDM